MAKAFINDENLTDIADAIRATLDESRQYLPSEMAAAIQSVPIMAQLNRKKYFQPVPAGAASGYATIERIEGNTVVWNQLVDTSSTSVVVQSGHVYYANIIGTASIATSDGTPISVTGGTDIIQDLTQMFGAGNEPTTVAEFESWLAQNIGTLPYYDYNAGELLNVKMSGMQTEDSSQQTLDTLPFDVTTITGINPNTNTREVMFSDGMNSTADGDVDVIDLTSDTAERATYLIPSIYQELEYLESDQNAYINLDIYATVNTVVHIKVSDSNSWVFGRTAGANGRWGLDNADFYSDHQSVGYTFSGIMDIICDFSRGLTVNGIDYNFSGTPVNPSNSVMYLFKASGSTAYPRGKIYFFDVYETGVLTMRLIPVRRISDSVLGLYDVVTDTLLTNAGTGSFIAGANVYKAHALDTPITYTDLQDANGNPLNPRYKVEQGGTEQVLPVNTTHTLCDQTQLIANSDYNNNGELRPFNGRYATPKIDVRNLNKIKLSYTASRRLYTAYCTYSNQSLVTRNSQWMIFGETSGVLDVSNVDEVTFFWWFEAGDTALPTISALAVETIPPTTVAPTLSTIYKKNN